MKSLLILTVIFSWPIFAKQIISTSRGVLGQVTGAVNDRSRGLFDRQKKFRQKERAAGWNEFKGGERRGGRRLGVGVGVLAGQRRGTRRQLLTSEGRRQAATRQRQIAAAKNAQDNQHLQQLGLNDDDGIAVMALSGGTAEGARQARDELYQQWLNPRRQALADQLAAGTITQADHDTQLLTAEAEIGQRADRALQAARTAKISRTNAQSAFTVMAQNKSRAIDPGNWEIIQSGIDRLAGGNAQEAGDIRDSFQYFSRGAGRFDIGGSRPIRDAAGNITGTESDARVGVRRASGYQLANAHPSTIRGAAARFQQTFNDPAASDEERLEAARFFNELQSFLPNATGEARDAIVAALSASDNPPGAGPTHQEVREAWLGAGTVVTGPGGVPLPRYQMAEVDHPTIPGARIQQQVPVIDPATGAAAIDTRTDREIAATQGLRTYQREDPNSPNLNPPTPPSDARLKTNVQFLRTTEAGINIYSFEYLWSPQVYVGVLAQEVIKICPEAVSVDSFGFYRVDYSLIDLEMTTLEAYQNQHLVHIA